jgi:peptidyl-prolyl cis-trans isomerase C
VNGAEIRAADLAAPVASDVAKYERLGVASSAQASVLATALRERRLQQRIDEELLYQAGSELSIPDLDQRVARRIEEAASRGGAGQGPPGDAPREAVRRQVVIDNYLRAKGLVEIPVPEGDVEAYYAKNKSSLATPETRRVRHVLVKVAANAGPAEEAAARAKIDRIRQAVASGREKLDHAARKHSDCSTAQAGGDLGDQRRGFMPKPFEDVAFELPVGKLGPVVRTQHGFHLLEVTGVTPPRVPELAEARDFIAKFLAPGLSRRAIAEHVAELRKRAKVEIVAAAPTPAAPAGTGIGAGSGLNTRAD